jgi:cytochrome P450 family 6
MVDKGIMVVIPVVAMHHDPKYYPDPDRFDPERFSEVEKKKRPHFSYLPFGEGPRICIGTSFWLYLQFVCVGC